MVEVGDTIYILDSVIDNEVANALVANNNKRAVKWESYRGVTFIVLSVDKSGSITIHDSQGHEISLSRRQYERDNRL